MSKDNNKLAEEDLSVPRISALVEFYSTRAVAHASFLVASIFGLITFLAIVQQLGANVVIYWLSVFLFLAFSYIGFFTLTRFGFYAGIADKLASKGLKAEQTLKAIKVVPTNKEEKREFDLYQYFDEQDTRQNRILIPKRLSSIKLPHISYWLIIFCLGVVAYSKFWSSLYDIGFFGPVWFVLAVGAMVICLVLLPYYYDSIRNGLRTWRKQKEKCLASFLYI
jgi:hypothetical protein